MKKAMVLSIAFALCISCNDADKTTTEATKDSTATGSASLPYTLKEKPDWERGNDNNVTVAMNALKGFETGDIDNTRQYFVDSAEFRGDYWHFKGTADSLMKEFKKFRSNYSNYTIRMEDYESVKSKNNGDEYVSLWYMETFTDKKGKVDSVFVMDDLKIVNGKIATIDSKVRHYPTLQRR